MKYTIHVPFSPVDIPGAHNWCIFHLSLLYAAGPTQLSTHVALAEEVVDLVVRRILKPVGIGPWVGGRRVKGLRVLMRGGNSEPAN